MCILVIRIRREEERVVLFECTQHRPMAAGNFLGRHFLMLTDWWWLCNVLDNVCTGSPSRATLHLVLLLPPSSRVGSPLALMAHQADKHSPRTAPTSTRTEDIAYVKKLFLEFWRNLGIRIVMEFQLCLDIS